MPTAQPDLASQINTAIDVVFATLSARGFWYGVGVGVVLILVLVALFVGRRYRAKSMTVNIPFGLGNIVYESSTEDRVLAWKMYVQLSTRKAALLFDESHDLVADVHTSLYEVFSITRDLLSGMPLADVKRPKGIADLILRTLNDGLRPHVTRWHAVYRRWWEQEIANEANSGKTPQDIQRQFPRYRDLVDDMKRTNTELARFADELLAIARADRPVPALVRSAAAPPFVIKGEDLQAMAGPMVDERSIKLPTTAYMPESRPVDDIATRKE